MTTLMKTSRNSFVRQRRTRGKPAQPGQKTAGNPTRQVYGTSTVYLPAGSRRTSQPASSKSRKKSSRNRYDLAFSLGDARVQAPALSLPQFSTRWISAFLAALMVTMLYVFSSSSMFNIATVELKGNQRIGASDVNAILSVIGQPVYKAIPARITSDLHTAFSELESVRVSVRLPNRVVISVVERTPIIAWYQDGAFTWIDAKGVAFMPRGDVPGLLQVAATGAPVDVVQDGIPTGGVQRFVSTGLIDALFALSAEVPAGSPMTYDPVYGIGWQDPRGWMVYFGRNGTDIPMKKQVYATILESLSKQGIQPSLISVEYLDAPFYK
jgi:cell division protein FtsQ